MERGLKGKTVLITGGSRGIGRSIAFAFAEQESQVVITGRNREALEAVAQEIRRRDGKAFPLRCDATNREEVIALEPEITRRWGRVKILVNNVGMARGAGFLQMDDHLWEEMIRVNLFTAYYCCKAFLPGMIASGWGRIINIASTVSKVALSHTTAYTTSKHAVLGFTRALALETARSGVTVNAICPGYVDTEATRRNAEQMAGKTGKTLCEILRLFERTSPQNRLIAPEEIAAMAVMLASEEARGITGQAVNVDGGAVMI